MNTLPLNEIIQGDCIETMKQWPDGCVDLVFGSPPYEDRRTYGIGFNLKGQDWVDWMIEVFRQSQRISKGLVAMVVEGYTDHFQWSASPALLMADLHRAGFKLRKPPLYRRHGIPGTGGPDWLSNKYEFIICTSQGKLPWSDNLACGHPPKWTPGGECTNRDKGGVRSNKKASRNRRPDGTREQRAYFAPGTSNPGNIIETAGDDGIQTALRQGGMRRANGERRQHGYNLSPVVVNPGNIVEELEQKDEMINCGVCGGGHMGHYLAHENEAPFPEKLAEFFIKSFCPEGGTVVDPFSGSGTTACSAVKNNRNFIGIDVRKSQIDLGNRRLLDVVTGLVGGSL